MREKRWLLCFLVAMCCTFSAWALPSQDKTVTLKLHNVSIETVLDAVKKQTGVNMLYNSQMFKGVPSVSLDVKNERWDTTLKLALNPQGFDYVMKDGIVVIRKQKRENRVRGMVTDSHGEPIPGASIIVKGTRTGTSTNIEGEFTLDVKSDKVVLEVSFIGMKKQTVQVDATRRKTVEITLVDDVKTLEDVVVTGYSNVRKSSFTGSSTQISGDDLRKVSQTNIIGAIQSFDPSFRLVDNVQFGSDPNALPEMYIRGRSGFGVKELDKDQLSKSNLENNPNLPTFIMDGFEVSIEKVYDLDPTRIESLTVLKDAAATAMYGSRAANGVVVITTVAPKAGEVRVSYNFTGTLEMPDLRDYNLANASEKLEIERLAGLFDKGQANIPSTAVGMNNYYKKYALIQKGVDTDWMSIPLQNSFNHKHSIYLEGGTPNLRYGVDGSFNIADGASLFAAIIVLAIMILPSIISVSLTALEAVPPEYEDASLALGATPIETYFKVSVPAAKSGIAAAVVLGVGRAIGEAMAVMMVSGNVANMPKLLGSVRFLTTAVASEMSYSSGLQKQALFSIALVLFLFIMLINALLNSLLKKEKE